MSAVLCLSVGPQCAAQGLPTADAGNCVDNEYTLEEVASSLPAEPWLGSETEIRIQEAGGLTTAQARGPSQIPPTLIPPPSCMLPPLGGSTKALLCH